MCRSSALPPPPSPRPLPFFDHRPGTHSKAAGTWQLPCEAFSKNSPGLCANLQAAVRSVTSKFALSVARVSCGGPHRFEPFHEEDQSAFPKRYTKTWRGMLQSKGLIKRTTGPSEYPASWPFSDQQLSSRALHEARRQVN